MCKNTVAQEMVMIARELMAIDFPTQDAMDKYLKQHPDADKTNHKVTETKKWNPSVNDEKLSPKELRDWKKNMRVGLPPRIPEKKVKSIDGMSPQEYAGQWGSTKGQGAAHFYNYSSEKQEKDAKFYDEFLNGKGGIRQTLKMVSDSLNEGKTEFEKKDLENLAKLVAHVEAESKEAKKKKAAKEMLVLARELLGKIPAKDEFKVGDVLDPQGKTNMVGVVTIREISGNTLKFTDSEGTDYYGMQRSQVRTLVNSGSWKRVK